MRRSVRPVVFAAATVPVVLLVGRVFTGGLGANPIEKITDVTGTWTLRFLLLTLAVTPLRRLTGWNEVVGLRRMLGSSPLLRHPPLLHVRRPRSVLCAGRHRPGRAKRPFITVGFTGFVLMVPLAVTSTAGWIRRLGGRRWQRLHRLAYASAAAGVVHYYWLVKADTSRPLRYAAMLAILLGARAVWSWRHMAGAGAGARGSGLGTHRPCISRGRKTGCGTFARPLGTAVWPQLPPLGGVNCPLAAICTGGARKALQF